MKKQKFTISTLLAFLFIFAGCVSQNAGATSALSIPETISVTSIPSQIPSPSITPPPLAVSVNGKGILLDDYQSELTRLQSALNEKGIEVSPEEQQQMVLNELIELNLLAQAAEASGFSIDEPTLQEKISSLEADIGGGDAFNAWKVQNGYSDESLKRALILSSMAAWQRDQIANSVPQTADQVHARQILVRSQQEAESILQQIQNGASFEDMAYQYDPLTGGELGWFPRGYLFIPAVEEAAFNLQPGEVSSIIESEYGYHIIQVIERDAQHPLSSDAWSTLSHKAVQDWLLEQRTNADIQIFVSP